jgi:hypothetical protein
MPEKFAVDFLARRKADRALAIDDFRDAFGVSYETAAHRFTNLATHHFGIPVHFARVHESGTIYKAYENDNVRFPADVTGAIEGQHACRGGRRGRCSRRGPVLVVLPVHRHGGRHVLVHGARRVDPVGEFSVTVGTPYEHARWFRGGDTTRRTVSRCPDPQVLPAAARGPGGHVGGARLAERAGALASARALPPGTFPGVDTQDVYEFLQRDRDRHLRDLGVVVALMSVRRLLNAPTTTPRSTEQIGHDGSRIEKRDASASN